MLNATAKAMDRIFDSDALYAVRFKPEHRRRGTHILYLHTDGYELREGIHVVERSALELLDRADVPYDFYEAQTGVMVVSEIYRHFGFDPDAVYSEPKAERQLQDAKLRELRQRIAATRAEHSTGGRRSYHGMRAALQHLLKR